MMAALTAPIEMPATQFGSARVAQSLVGAGLIGSERTAALQDEEFFLSSQ